MDSHLVKGILYPNIIESIYKQYLSMLIRKAVMESVIEAGSEVSKMIFQVGMSYTANYFFVDCVCSYDGLGLTENRCNARGMIYLGEIDGNVLSRGEVGFEKDGQPTQLGEILSGAVLTTHALLRDCILNNDGNAELLYKLFLASIYGIMGMIADFVKQKDKFERSRYIHFYAVGNEKCGKYDEWYDLNTRIEFCGSVEGIAEDSRLPFELPKDAEYLGYVTPDKWYIMMAKVFLPNWDNVLHNVPKYADKMFEWCEK